MTIRAPLTQHWAVLAKAAKRWYVCQCCVSGHFHQLSAQQLGRSMVVLAVASIQGCSVFQQLFSSAIPSALRGPVLTDRSGLPRYWSAVWSMISASQLADSTHTKKLRYLCRFWECVARRMAIYEFYFLDPRLISIQFEPNSKRKRRKSAND